MYYVSTSEIRPLFLPITFTSISLSTHTKTQNTWRRTCTNKPRPHTFPAKTFPYPLSHTILFPAESGPALPLPLLNGSCNSVWRAHNPVPCRERPGPTAAQQIKAATVCGGGQQLQAGVAGGQLENKLAGFVELEGFANKLKLQ